MQTLEERNTYTPPNAPQVRCNCDPSLNREETLSVGGLKTSSNNSEVDLLVSESSRTGTCEYSVKKLSHLLTKEHDSQLSSKLANIPRGRFIHCLNAVVFSTP